MSAAGVAARVAGAGHLGAGEDVLGNVLLVRHARDLFDDGAERDVAAVAILIALAGRESGRQGADEAEVIGIRANCDFGARVNSAPKKSARPPRMCQQLLDGGRTADCLRIVRKELASVSVSDSLPAATS